MRLSAATGGRPLARGDVILVRFPFTDLTSAKLRPAVVLWAGPAQTDYVLAFVSSQIPSAVGPCDVPVLPTHPEFGLTGLAAASYIRASKLVTLNRALVIRWLGQIGTRLSADLDRALIAALGLNTAPYREEGRRSERERLIALHAAGSAPAVLADLCLPTSPGG